MYGDPYSGINQTIGQAYGQNAQIREQGNSQATALTQHFLDAFIKARQEAEQKKMQEAMIAHQHAQEAAAVARQQALDSNNLYDDWSKTGTEGNVRAFDQRAKLLNVPSPVPEQQFKPAVPAFTGGSDQALAPENNPTMSIDGEDQQIQLMPQNAGGMEKSAIPRVGSIFEQNQKKQDVQSAVALMNAEAKQTMAELAVEQNPAKIKALQARQAQIESSIANVGAGMDYKRELLKVQRGKLEVSRGRLALGQDIEGRQVGQTAIKNNASVASGNAAVDMANTAFDSVENIARDLQTHPGLKSATGVWGNLGISHLKGTDARNAQAQIDALKAQLGMQQLSDMRAASKNGSAGLGQVTEQEHKLLQSMVAALDPGQDTETFKKELQKVIDRVAISKARIKAQYDADIGSGLYQNPRGQGQGGAATNQEGTISKSGKYIWSNGAWKLR